MKFIPIVILLGVALGCANRSSERPESGTPTPSSEKIVANKNVRDPKARFLGEATAYIANLFHTDEAIAQEMAKADSGKMDLDQFLTLLKDAAQTEKDGFGNIEVRPPALYNPLLTKLIKIHNGHGAAYMEYTKALIAIKNTKEARKHVDKADAILKQSLYDLNDAQKFISSAMRELE
jgi:hypothetical protein